VSAREIAPDRFLTPEEVAALFRRTVAWVYNNSLPAKGYRRAGFLFPAARRFNARTLLFDREGVERIVAAASIPAT
jgi:hypothetical protein